VAEIIRCPDGKYSLSRDNANEHNLLLDMYSYVLEAFPAILLDR